MPASHQDLLLPFSLPPERAVQDRLARELAETLALPVEIRIVEGDGVSGLDRERRFRRQWWTSGDEPLRTALHAAKTRIYRQARTAGTWKDLTNAWQEAEKAVTSEPWREHLRRLIQGVDPDGASYLRLVFQAAQQVSSRAARWRAVLPDPNPFRPMAELFARGAWPLGCHLDFLWIFVWGATPGPAPDFGPPLAHPETSDGSYLFLSSQFHETESTREWERALRARGWEVVHGPVDEEIAPPEVQLGRRIRGASAVVGLLSELDPDFGLPWWMFQELDYARACGRPVRIVEGAIDALPESLEEHELWRWLGDGVRTGGVA